MSLLYFVFISPQIKNFGQSNRLLTLPAIPQSNAVASVKLPFQAHIPRLKSIYGTVDHRCQVRTHSECLVGTQFVLGASMN